MKFIKLAKSKNNTLNDADVIIPLSFFTEFNIKRLDVDHHEFHYHCQLFLNNGFHYAFNAHMGDVIEFENWLIGHVEDDEGQQEVYKSNLFTFNLDEYLYWSNKD